ncbi:phosphatase 2C-like domain-containing protein [Scenedesmus sp. NREL 46B-D3]|nr:phosphatase 2C-like domain-containing protein [Scenedesmus sp. NREL 46B-D3]
MSLHLKAQCSAAQQQQRYEDVILQAPAPAGNGSSRSFSCWALFDGYNGDTVAQFLGSSLLPELENRLPAMPLPQAEPEQCVYADAVRRAVTATFLSLSLRVRDLTSGKAAGCGSAATVVVQTGHLLTVANAGSSKCVLDVGQCAIECSADHRLGNNEDEEDRLNAAGAYVARLKFDLSGPAAPGELGCGPLRLWPGGLHMSRAIGDSDCGQLVIPHPYIQQVWLPSRPSRLIMANGGMWDVFESWHKAASALRGVSLQNAAGALLQRALKRKQHRADRGDMSVLVLDFCPESSSSCCCCFVSQAQLGALSRSSNCSSQGMSSSAPSPLPRAAARKLSLAGMQVHPQQQPQQQLLQRKADHQLQHSSKAGSPLPLLTPCSSSKSSCSSQQQEQLQQQTEQLQPQHSGGLLARLLPVLCFSTNAFGVADSRGAASRASSALPSPSRGLQKQLSACSSSSCSDGAAPSSTPASSSMQSSCSSSWQLRSSSSWRKNACADASAAAQHPQQQQDPSVLRIAARCDSFQAYCRGQYARLEQQLATLEASCGWTTLQATCRQPSLHDTQRDQARLDSGSGADQLQQQRQADGLKVSSGADAAVRVSVGA